jgi:HAD superfamily hydrolase (TIGR01509 family)
MAGLSHSKACNQDFNQEHNPRMGVVFLQWGVLFLWQEDKMAIKGLIFDFDGLIVDSETPKYMAWQEIFQSYDSELPLSEWKVVLGTLSTFDPAVYLAEKIGKTVGPFDQPKRAMELILQEPPRPGIAETLRAARQRGIKLAIGSSAPISWVHPLLHHLDLFNCFDLVICRDHVDHIKPHPEVYLRCIADLGIDKEEAIVFEDSPNGILAANAAGIFSVAIPNYLTAQLDLSQAGMVLERIDQIPLDELLGKAERIINSEFS